jgi:hypothetical protein
MTISHYVIFFVSSKILMGKTLFQVKNLKIKKKKFLIKSHTRGWRSYSIYGSKSKAIERRWKISWLDEREFNIGWRKSRSFICFFY